MPPSWPRRRGRIVDNIASRTPADIIAGTPINEPGVVYQYRATDSTAVWLDINNREVLDALQAKNPASVRKLYTDAPNQMLRQVLLDLVALDGNAVNGDVLARIAQEKLDALPPIE